MIANVYITIDVECTLTSIKDDAVPAGVDQRVYCKFGEQQVGLPLIIDLLDRYKVTGIFFCDTTMKYLAGDEAAAEVFRYIHNRGHQVQLHIHPMNKFWACRSDETNLPRDQWTDNIGDLPEKIQYELIMEGIDDIERYIGVKPTAFRAGNYGASLNTLDKLAEFGIRYDSSYNLWTAGGGSYYRPMFEREVNTPFYYNKVKEFPVTTFYIGNSGSKYRFFAPEGASYGEMKSALNALLNNEVNDIVMVLHSFTFAKSPDKSYTKISFNSIAYQRFEKILSYITLSSQFRICTFESHDEALQCYPEIDALKIASIPWVYSLPRGLGQLIQKYL